MSKSYSISCKICVNKVDQWIYAGSGIFYLDGPHMPGKNRHGISFGGPTLSKIERMRELALLLTQTANAHERLLTPEERAPT